MFIPACGFLWRLTRSQPQVAAQGAAVFWNLWVFEKTEILGPPKTFSESQGLKNRIALLIHLLIWSLTVWLFNSC